MTGKQHTAQNVGGPVITITTIRHSLQWHTLSSRTVKPLIFFSLFLFSFLFTSCSLFPTAPIDEDITPGRRDYIWRVDTIFSNSSLYQMDGQSPNKIWLYGSGDPGKSIVEVNDTSWKIRIDIRINSIISISVIDSNRVYLCNTDGIIYRYYNNSFIYDREIVIPGGRFICYQITARENDLLFLGSVYYFGTDSFSAAAFIYKNGQIKPFTLDTENKISAYNYIVTNGYDTLMRAVTFDNPIDSCRIYRVKNNRLELLLKKTYGDDEILSAYKINGELLVQSGPNLYRYSHNELVPFSFCTSTTPPFFEGRNLSDIFAVSRDGISHYNGTDWKYLFKMGGEQLRFHGAFITEKDVYFLAHDWGTYANYLVHGKFK